MAAVARFADNHSDNLFADNHSDKHFCIAFSVNKDLPQKYL